MTKVTIDMVNDHIAKTEYFHIGKKTTICLLTLINGMEVVGFSHCQKVEDFNSEIGNKFAREHAIDKAFLIVIASTLSKNQ